MRRAATNTIRVDSKVVHETDSDQAKSDESAWMRLTLDTVGKIGLARDRQGRPIYPDGFEELAKKLGKPLHPPGRDVCCIVSVGNADRRLGLQHGHAHRGVAALHVAAPVRAGGRPRAPPLELRGRRGRPADAKRSPRCSACRSRSSRSRRTSGGSRTPAPKRHHVHALPAKGASRDPLPARRRLSPGHPEPSSPSTGRACPPMHARPDEDPARGGDEGGPAEQHRAARHWRGRASSSASTSTPIAPGTRFQQLVFDLRGRSHP